MGNSVVENSLNAWIGLIKIVGIHHSIYGLYDMIYIFSTGVVFSITWLHNVVSVATTNQMWNLPVSVPGVLYNLMNWYAFINLHLVL